MNSVTPTLVQGVLLLVVVLHLAWTGLIAGTATVALAVDGLGGAGIRGTAPAIHRLARPGLVTLALLEASATLVLVGARLVHPRLVQTGAFWAGVLVPLVAGLALIALFGSLLQGERPRALRQAAGLGGIGLVLASCFLLCSGSGVLLKPEAWPTSEPAFRFILTWSGTGRFAEFTCFSLSATGGAIMLLGHRMEGTAGAPFLRRFGGRLALVSLLAWPAALLFTHLNLPAIALSPGVWLVAAAGLVVAGASALLAAGSTEEVRPLRVRALLAASLGLFGVLAASDHLARENALDEATLAGVTAAPAPEAPTEAAPALAGRLSAGKAVFDRVCHLCHRFDTKLVGPPFDAVVPKYRADPQALRAFIRSPVKKDPSYPAMPKPAVDEAEIDAVAAYLLEQAKP